MSTVTTSPLNDSFVTRYLFNFI